MNIRRVFIHDDAKGKRIATLMLEDGLVSNVKEAKGKYLGEFDVYKLSADSVRKIANIWDASEERIAYWNALDIADAIVDKPERYGLTPYQALDVYEAIMGYYPLGGKPAREV